jgi:hypothetical protein
MSTELEFVDYAGKLFDRMLEGDVCNLFTKITTMKLEKISQIIEWIYPRIENYRILIVA